MKTIFYFEGKKTTRKAMKEKVGEERLKRMLEESKERFFNDPLEQQSWWIGSGVMTIEFR